MKDFPPRLPRIRIADPDKRGEAMRKLVDDQPEHLRQYGQRAIKRFELARNAKRNVAARWDLIERFIAGFHFEAVERLTAEMKGWEGGHSRSRFVENHFPTITDSFVSAIIGARPVPIFRPHSSSYEDRQIARAAEDMVQYLWIQLQMAGQHHPEAVEWYAKTGTAIYKLFWNKYAPPAMMTEDGRPDREVPDPGQQVIPKPGAGLGGSGGGGEVMEGWFGNYAVNPHSFFAFPIGSDLERLPWIQEAHLYHETEAELYFPVLEVLRRAGDDSQLHVVSFDQREIPAVEEAMKEMVCVLEEYDNPSPNFPEGESALVHYPSGFVLAYSETRGKYGYPYRITRHGHTTGLWGESFLWPCVGPQFQLDLSQSQMIDHRNDHVYPPLKKPEGAVFKHEEVFGIPREVVTVDEAMGKVEYLVTPDLDETVVLGTQDLRRQLSVLAGNPDFMRGMTPSDKSFSGRAVGFLVELYRQMMGPVAERFEASHAWWAQRAIRLLRDNVPGSFVYWIVGSPRAYDVRELVVRDLNTFQVETQQGSLLTRNKELERDRIIELARTGIIPVDPRRLSELLDIGGFQQILGDQSVARSEARRENYALIDPDNDTPPIPMWYEDHATMFAEHVDFTSSEAYKNAPQERKLLFQKHLEQTYQYWSAQLQTMQGGGQGAEAAAEGEPAKEPGVRTGEEAELAAGAGIAGPGAGMGM